MDASGPPRAVLLEAIQAAHAATGRPSIRQLERETGVSNSVISRALTGERIPSRPALLALADALDGDLEEWGRLRDACAAPRKARRSSDQAEVLAALAPHGAGFAMRGRIPTCAVEGCVRTYYARGLCRAHYERWRRARAKGEVA